MAYGYQKYGYSTTTNNYWFASRFMNEDSVCVNFYLRVAIDGSAREYDCIWGVMEDGAVVGSIVSAVRPVVRVEVGNVSGL